MDLFKNTYHLHPAYKLYCSMIEQYSFDLKNNNAYNHNCKSTSELLFYQAAQLHKIEVVANGLWSFLITNAYFTSNESKIEVEKVLDQTVRLVHGFKEARIFYTIPGVKETLGSVDDVTEQHLLMINQKEV